MKPVRDVLRFLRTYPLSIILFAVITYLCLMRVPKTPLDGIWGIDKFVHAGVYVLLCGVIWWEHLQAHALEDCSWRLLMGTALLPLAFSGMVELMQACLDTGRSGEWLDMLANAIGIFLGNLGAYLCARVRGGRSSC